MLAGNPQETNLREKNSSHRVTDVCFKFNSFIKKKAADKTKIQKKIEVLAGASGAEQQVSEE